MAEGFPERLRRVRDYLDLSATQMAERVGLSVRKTWERYEKGDTRPNSDVMSALLGMGIDIHWLLTGDGAMLRSAASDGQAAAALDDRLYEIAIAATLGWYETAKLEAPVESMAGMISRAVRMLRSRPNIAEWTEADIRAEVGNILDVAREMLSQSGWSPGRG